MFAHKTPLTLVERGVCTQRSEPQPPGVPQADVSTVRLVSTGFKTCTPLPPALSKPGHMGPGLGPLRGQESLGEFYFSRLLLSFFLIKKNISFKNWDKYALHFSSLRI